MDVWQGLAMGQGSNRLKVFVNGFVRRAILILIKYMQEFPFLHHFNCLKNSAQFVAVK
jgi:hypothetical protein